MLGNIRSKYILIHICSIIKKERLLKLIKPNKKLQSLLDISFNEYKNFGKIIIEVFPSVTSNKDEKFINYDEKKESSYHIYLNNDSEELQMNFIKRFFYKKNYISRRDNIKKIRIEIDKKIKSLKGLFEDCVCLKKIKFIEFNNDNITDMSEMFSGCLSLINLDILNVNTEKVKNMENMFKMCKKLKKLDLQNFKTNNVVNMNGMFYYCNALEELNFLIFDTSNVTKINDLFYKCTSLKEVNIYNTDKYPDEREIKKIHTLYPYLGKMNILNFNTSKVKDMSFMFYCCYSLKIFHIINFDTSQIKVMNRIFMDCKQLVDINLSNFVIYPETSAFMAFSGCSETIIKKVKEQLKDADKKSLFASE